ncbi:glycoside hydrolase N-terminal domain-containing protein [Streptomyces sp. NPDC008159]|uniref:glycoside hydrolase N-terminal domain-containing protein n=1 Tax=Streptomyces sp. NPDC008159 TaxID=3364817 RepID=UPI0036EC59E9
MWTGGPGSAQGYDHGNWTEPHPGAISAVQDRIDAETKVAPAAVTVRLGQRRVGYGHHQTFGDLHFDLPGDPDTVPADYRRGVDLREAMASVTYTHRQRRHTREFFASHPDGVLSGRLTGGVTVTLRPTSPRSDVTATATGDRITVRALTAGRTRELTVRSDLLPGGELTFRAVAGRRYVWSR